jgi:hypothetical protein
MAERGMFQTSDLVPLLAERGITLSREQVYRLVAQSPQRLSMDTLGAFRDILECTCRSGWLRPLSRRTVTHSVTYRQRAGSMGSY